jgi:hypothetical protein
MRVLCHPAIVGDDEFVESHRTLSLLEQAFSRVLQAFAPVGRAYLSACRRSFGSTRTSSPRVSGSEGSRPMCQGVTITTRPFPKASVVAYSVPSAATSTAAGSFTSTSTDASPSTIWEI